MVKWNYVYSKKKMWRFFFHFLISRVDYVTDVKMHDKSLQILSSAYNFLFRFQIPISNISFKKLSSFYYIFPFPHPISDFIWYHPSVSENCISIFVLIIFTSSMFFLLCFLVWRGGPLIFNRFQNILVKIIWRNV